jgi:hypothetical protein
VGSVCKQINRIYGNEDEDMKETFWSNVTVSMDLAELCLQDHQKLGRTQKEIRKMVDEIRKLAAKLGNEAVFKWAIRNDSYFMELFEDEDLFLDVAKKGHLRVLEIAHSNRLEWYSREMLEDAAARYDVQLWYFIFNKKPDEFDLSFTKLCVTEGFIEALEWWKNAEMFALFAEAAYSGQAMENAG